MASVSTLTKGLAILDYVIKADKPQKLMDVVQAMDLDRGMAFRFLQTLCEFGLLHKDKDDKRYSAGARFYSWMLKAHSRLAVVDVARPYLRDVAKRTNQSAHLGMLIDDNVLLIDYVASENLISIRNRIGVSEPVYCTAIGKSILMSMPKHERTALLDRIEIRDFTDRTITSRAELERHLEAAAAAGFAYDDGEFNDLLACVAVPLRSSPDSSPSLAIGVSMLRPALGDAAGAAAAAVADELAAAARELEGRIAGIGIQDQIS